jgi:transposase
MEANKSQKRPRRQFTDEFKAGAVQQVLGEGRSSADVARSLDLTRSALDQWVKQALVDSGKGVAGALTTSEREELAQLRSENRRLKMERDILKKAAAFFAKENG